MENKKFIPHAVKWGIILGASRVLLDIVLKITDANALLFSMSSIIGFVIEIVLIFIAIKIYRDSENNGQLVITEAIKIGVIMMLLTGALYFVSSQFFMPEFAINKSMEVLENYNPEMAETMAENIDKATENPKYILSFFTTILWFSFLGLLVSLISGLILKKEEQYI